MSHTGWIGVDLDGTLAKYDGWISENHIGDPILPMAIRVCRWLAAGRDVRIFTARVCNDPEGKIALVIQGWCKEHLGQVLPVTNKKDYQMVELWDDRCVQVTPNLGTRADGKD